MKIGKRDANRNLEELLKEEQTKSHVVLKRILFREISEGSLDISPRLKVVSESMIFP